jgi:sulfoxide reductase heme-binding subunit YedZ
MRRKILIALILALIAIFVIPGSVLADTASATVNMSGQAVITPGQRTTQIEMDLTSSDTADWHITLDLVVPVPQSESDDEGEVEETDYRTSAAVTSYDIQGSFTLGSTAQDLSSGTVSGTLNLNGAGEITLAGNNDSASLSMAFTIYDNGAVAAVAEGEWPVIPSVESPPTTTTTTTTTAIVPPAATTPPPTYTTITMPAAVQTTVQQTVPQVTVPVAEQSNNHLFWYISRTSALMAYILLFINICLGIGLKTKSLDGLMRRWRTFDLHQFTAILGGALILLHVFSLLGDDYFNFTVSQLLVPMSSPYRPFWTALGSLALYAGAVIALSSFVRKLIGQKVWRALHYVSYLLFFVILFHGIMAGTDSSTVWVKWMYISTGTITAFLFLWRFFSYRAKQAPMESKIQISPREQADGNTVSSEPWR